MPFIQYISIIFTLPISILYNFMIHNAKVSLTIQIWMAIW